MSRITDSQVHSHAFHCSSADTCHSRLAGIVFSCTKGTVDLETPIALIQEGGKFLFAAEWTQSQLDFVRHLQPMALSHWWQPNHTNWDLLEWDSDVYKGSGQLVKAQIVRTYPSCFIDFIFESGSASFNAVAFFLPNDVFNTAG